MNMDTRFGTLCDYRPKRLAPLAISYFAKDAPIPRRNLTVVPSERRHEPARESRIIEPHIVTAGCSGSDTGSARRISIRIRPHGSRFAPIPYEKCPMPLVISIHRLESVEYEIRTNSNKPTTLCAIEDWRQGPEGRGGTGVMSPARHACSQPVSPSING